MKSIYSKSALLNVLKFIRRDSSLENARPLQRPVICWEQKVTQQIAQQDRSTENIESKFQICEDTFNVLTTVDKVLLQTSYRLLMITFELSLPAP